MVILFVLVTTSYRWSFGSNSLRSSHWAYESACFVQSILCNLVDEDSLPSVFDVRSSLEVDVGSLVLSDEKLQVLRGEFSVHLADFDDAAVFDEQVSMVRQFLLLAVEEVLALPGIREEVTCHLIVCCPAVLLCADDAILFNEVEQFTVLLMDLN